MAMRSRSHESLCSRDPLVERVVRRIARSVKPERVILFGSRATGDAREDSDIDLVVVYSGPKTKRQIQVGIHRLFPNPDFSMDVFVLSPEELESQKTIANTLAREVAERGVECYPDNWREIPEAEAQDAVGKAGDAMAFTRARLNL